jgi:hypothetical protein
LKITVESFYATNFQAYFSKDGSNFYSINDNVVVSAGDGVVPDTTTFYWNFEPYNLSGTFTIKVSVSADTIFTGSETTPYYQIADKVYSGDRSNPTFAQSQIQWSNMYVYNDSLYSLESFSFVYGWYDYMDQITLWEWNPATDSFAVRERHPVPGSAIYPHMETYRSSPTNYVMWNGQTGTSGYYLSQYKTATITYPNTISDWSSAHSGLPPTNIDAQPNTSITYDGWTYTLDPVARTITAEDVYNPGNRILVTDASAGGAFAENNIDFYVFDHHVIVSRKYWQSEFGNAAVYLVGAAFPPNSPAGSDQVSFSFNNIAQRNFFRGVYPEAIIIYYPPVR